MQKRKTKKEFWGEEEEGNDRQTCVECGNSVAMGSGRFVNRVPVLDDYDVRAENYPHPEGEYLCAECDEKCDKVII